MPPSNLFSLLDTSDDDIDSETEFPIYRSISPYDKHVRELGLLMKERLTPEDFTPRELRQLGVERSFRSSSGHFLIHHVAGSHRKRGTQEKCEIAFGKLCRPEIYDPDAKPVLRIRREDLRGDKRDFQGMDWTKFGLTRAKVREQRMRKWQNLSGVHSSAQLTKLVETYRASIIENEEENFFMFRNMDLSNNVSCMGHERRHMVAYMGRNQIFYGMRSKVMVKDPHFGTQVILNMKLGYDASPNNFNGVQISTIAAGHDVVIAGGYHGEFGMRCLPKPGLTAMKRSDGPAMDGIVNHIDIFQARSSDSPHALFVSRGRGGPDQYRLLNCSSGTFANTVPVRIGWNCTAQSPDRLLRVCVGPNKDVLILEADSFKPIRSLKGHFDSIHACAWSDDGYTVATGSQDKLVKIWDARKWSDSKGNSISLATIAAKMASVRSLKFSPVGSGPRVLMAAEEADVVRLIHARDWKSAQTFEVVGDIAGADFSDDGQGIAVGVHDDLKGGVMEFERCGWDGQNDDEYLGAALPKKSRENAVHGSDTAVEDLGQHLVLVSLRGTSYKCPIPKEVQGRSSNGEPPSVVPVLPEPRAWTNGVSSKVQIIDVNTDQQPDIDSERAMGTKWRRMAAKV